MCVSTLCTLRCSSPQRSLHGLDFQGSTASSGRPSHTRYTYPSAGPVPPSPRVPMRLNKRHVPHGLCPPSWVCSAGHPQPDAHSRIHKTSCLRLPRHGRRGRACKAAPPPTRGSSTSDTPTRTVAPGPMSAGRQIPRPRRWTCRVRPCKMRPPSPSETTHALVAPHAAGHRVCAPPPAHDGA